MKTPSALSSLVLTMLSTGILSATIPPPSNPTHNICIPFGEACNIEEQDCCDGLCSIKPNVYLSDDKDRQSFRNVSECEGKHAQEKPIHHNVGETCAPPTAACSPDLQDCCNGPCVTWGNVASHNLKKKKYNVLQVTACELDDTTFPKERRDQVQESRRLPNLNSKPIPTTAHISSPATLEDGSAGSEPSGTHISLARPFRTLSRRDKAWCAGPAQLCDIVRQDCCKGMCGHYHFVPLCEVKDDSINKS